MSQIYLFQMANVKVGIFFHTGTSNKKGEKIESLNYSSKQICEKSFFCSKIM